MEARPPERQTRSVNAPCREAVLLWQRDLTLARTRALYMDGRSSGGTRELMKLGFELARHAQCLSVAGL